jgi:type VI secretion system protein ImpB
VETLGSIVKTELPFVVGIMADLSGNTISKTQGKPLKDRKYVEIDRDNFDTIMEKVAPTVQLKTPGLSGSLTFKKLEDFNPINVLRRVPSLSEKFDSRTRLSNLVAKLDGNIELQKAFIDSYGKLNAADKTALDNYYKAMNPTPGTPTVTDAETTPGAQTTTGLVITPDESGAKATHFKITNITGGSLFQHDGKAPPITVNSFITADDGAAGLKFTPTDATTRDCSFTVQASTNNTATDNNTGFIGDPVIATITVVPAETAEKTNTTPATRKPKVTPETIQTDKNAQSAAIRITPDAADTTVTHFQITKITNGQLFQAADVTKKIEEGVFIPLVNGAAEVKFTPTTDFTGNGSFTVTASTKDKAEGLLADNTATVTITVK